MSNEVAAQQQQQLVNPYLSQQRDLAPGVNAGAVTIEVERAIAEVKAKLMIAKSMPRDPVAAWEKLMRACSLPGMAEAAFYSYKRGGEQVTGPSIRLAEAIASAWGNIDYGMRELSNKDGVTELEAYAWDLETNTLTTQRFTVHHRRDTRSGGYALTDQRDIYELGANMGARRMRARILAVLPADIVKAAEDKCRQTLAGGGGVPISERVKKMLAAFEPFGVNKKRIESYLGKKLDDVLPDDIVTLTGVFNAIRDGSTTVAEAFDAKTEAPQLTDPKPAANQNSQQEATPEKPAGTGQVQEPAPASGRRRAAAKPAAAEQPASEVKQEQAAPEPEAAKEPETQQPPEDNNPPPADEDLEGLFGGDETPEGDDGDPF